MNLLLVLLGPVLLMMVVAVLFVRSGLRRPDTERRWVAHTWWPVLVLVGCFGFASVSGVLGDAGSDADAPALVTLLLTPVLLLFGLTAVWRRPSRGGGASHYRRALAPAVMVVVGAGAFPVLVDSTVAMTVEAATRGNFARELPVVVAATLAAVAVFVAGTKALHAHVTRRARLVVDATGLEYALDRYRIWRVPWNHVTRIEQQPLGTHGPPALVVWLSPNAGPPPEWVASLWWPQLGAYAITDLKRLGVNPKRLAEAIMHHRTARDARSGTGPPVT